MSNETPSTASQSQPNGSQTQKIFREEEAVDFLLRLATVDIPSEQRRIKQVKDPTSPQLQQEIAGTVLELLKEVARNQVELRDWNVSYLNALSDHVEALDQRVETVETYGAETTITPEDAETLAKAVLGCKYIATQLLNGPFPIDERDEEGKQKLAELIAIAEQSERIITDSTIVLDDDLDDDDDEEEMEDQVGTS
jgi:hypothetical protein